MPSTYKTTDNENFDEVGATPTQVNHLVWQGLPGVYLAATNNGPMKSVDGGQTWAYIRPNATFGTTWPAGAIGRQVSFGVGPRECNETGVGETYYLSFYSTGPDFFGDNKLYRWNSGWEFISSLPVNTDYASVFGFALSPLGFLVGRMGSFVSLKELFSSNNGLGWGVTSPGIYLSRIRGNPTRWYAFSGNGVTGVVMADSSLNWVDITPPTMITFADNIDLVSHPIKDYVAVSHTDWTGVGSSHAVKVSVSNSGGGSWVTTTVATVSSSAFITVRLVWFGDRLIVTYQDREGGAQFDPTKQYTAFSDDFGVTWSTPNLLFNVSSPRYGLLVASENAVWMFPEAQITGMANYPNFFRSLDGETWETFTSSPYPAGDSRFGVYTAAFNGVTGSLLVMSVQDDHQFSVNPAKTWELKDAETVSPGSEQWLSYDNPEQDIPEAYGMMVAEGQAFALT